MERRGWLERDVAFWLWDVILLRVRSPLLEQHLWKHPVWMEGCSALKCLRMSVDGHIDVPPGCLVTVLGSCWHTLREPLSSMGSSWLKPIRGATSGRAVCHPIFSSHTPSLAGPALHGDLPWGAGSHAAWACKGCWFLVPSP